MPTQVIMIDTRCMGTIEVRSNVNRYICLFIGYSILDAVREFVFYVFFEATNTESLPRA